VRRLIYAVRRLRSGGLETSYGVEGRQAARRGDIMEPMKPYAGSRRHLASSPFKPPVPEVVETFVVDERVTHDKYGLGRVVAVEGEQAVVVDFGTSRTRLMRPFAKLHKL
jgi:hypothetical protein